MLIVDDDQAEDGVFSWLKWLSPDLIIRMPWVLDYGFYGNGPEGTVGVGIERKKPDDLVSSLRNGRLVNQFTVAHPTCTYMYLLQEGHILPDRYSGAAIKRAGRVWKQTASPISHRELDGRMSTLQVKVGIRIIESFDEFDSAFRILSLYHWWQTPFEEHGSDVSFWSPVYLTGRSPLIVRMVAQIDGIGMKRAQLAAQRFGSVFGLVTADEDQWTDIEGIGKPTAKRIVAALHEIGVR
jgi:ERCC4-type nuclease